MKIIWTKLAKKYSLEIEISGLDTLPSFSFKDNDNQKMQTYFTREMLNLTFLLLDNLDHVILIKKNTYLFTKNVLIKFFINYQKKNIIN